METEDALSKQWRKMLEEGETLHRLELKVMRLIPSNPRCKACYAPFEGIGRILMPLMGKRRSTQNPNYCDLCMRSMPTGGAEIDLTMLFADVRDSTKIAEQMSASDFSRLMSRFYNVATDVLIKHDALIDKLVGDEVIGLFLPGISGRHHASLAVRAAQSLLRATGHDDPHGAWLPIGVGVHTGRAFVGAIHGTEGILTNLTALGDNMNVSARLASNAKAGEILVSDAAYAASGMNFAGSERRELELKGKSRSVTVRVLQTDKRGA